MNADISHKTCINDISHTAVKTSRDKMLKMGWFGVVMSHSKSLEIAPFDRAQKHIQVPISVP